MALTSTESETNENNSCTNNQVDMPLIENNMEIDFREHLLAFQDTVPRYMKNKKARKQKKKVKKNHTDGSVLFMTIILNNMHLFKYNTFLRLKNILVMFYAVRKQSIYYATENVSI